MAYNQQYEEGDIAEGIINFIVKGIIVVGIFAVLIVLVLLYGWFRKKI